MKTLFLSIGLFLVISNCSAQTDTVRPIKRLTGADKDKTYARVTMEAYFPGGQRAWLIFLQDNLDYPKKAKRKNIQGTVIVTFMVNVDGTLSDIQAASGPEELKQAAIDVVKKSPNWSPAVSNGKKIQSYKKQPINFSIQS
jgi:periplasmic protein TonB